MIAPVLASSAAFGLGGIFMKPSAGLTRLMPTVAVVVCFLAGALFLTLAVHRASLSSVIIIGLGLEALISIAIGIFIMGERLTVHQAIGVVLILGGVAMMRAR